MRMELRDVEYFAVVAKHRHIGRAAESLGLGQPALSKSLRRLELAAKTRLLVRTPKGVEPTAAGAALLSRIHRLRLAFDDVTQEVSDIGQGRVGHLRIGAIAGCVEYPLAPACRLIMQEAPELTVNVTADPVDVLIPLLLNGEFDLLVIPQFPTPRQEIIQEYLFEDRFGVIASEEHKLVKRKAVKLAELLIRHDEVFMQRSAHAGLESIS
jgi:DNA-binding transcriptional LysR family regulator